MFYGSGHHKHQKRTQRQHRSQDQDELSAFFQRGTPVLRCEGADRCQNRKEVLEGGAIAGQERDLFPLRGAVLIGLLRGGVCGINMGCTPLQKVRTV